MGFSEDIKKFYSVKKLKTMLRDSAQFGVVIGKEKFVPKGTPPFELSNSLLASEVIERPGSLSVFITAGAFNNGFDYSKFQHDVSLKHVVGQGQPMVSSFADYGTGTGPKAYSSGYRLLAPSISQKWPTKFMDKTIEVIAPILDDELERWPR